MRRPQFRLRSLFILTAIVAVVVAAGRLGWRAVDMQNGPDSKWRIIYEWAVCYYISLALAILGAATFGWLCRKKHRGAFFWLSFLPMIVGMIGYCHGGGISYSGNVATIIDVGMPALFVSTLATMCLFAISGAGIAWNLLSGERLRESRKQAANCSPLP
jgi:hypothetical protein